MELALILISMASFFALIVVWAMMPTHAEESPSAAPAAQGAH